MIRILLDEDIHKSAAEQLRLRGYDAVHIVEKSRTGLSDNAQLLYAHSEGRILISFNIKDYIKLHKKFIKEGKQHSGIILSKQVPIGEFIKKLAQQLHQETIFDNSIFFL
jgi:uncharacterized protein with PIN domain